MLIIEIVNTNEGTNENAHYRYAVRVNSEEIARGSFDGHNRNDGWAELVRAISERHLTPRALDGANETLKVIGNATYCKNCGHWLWRESPRQ